MKTLKLDHHLALSVLSGIKTSTWRLNDDKDIKAGDNLELIDKIDPDSESSWQVIGVAKVSRVVEKPLGRLTDQDWAGHERYSSDEAMYTAYRKYYGPDISPDSIIKMVHFDFAPYQPSRDYRTEHNRGAK